ncbi:hypothetical protein BT69DRAFT_1354418, partial [Atractiella rhizophila]
MEPEMTDGEIDIATSSTQIFCPISPLPLPTTPSGVSTALCLLTHPLLLQKVHPSSHLPDSSRPTSAS